MKPIRYAQGNFLRRWAPATLFLAAALWFAGRYLAMARSPFLGGADAYYYALQLRSLVETGALKIPDFSPLYGLLWTTAKLGLSYEHAIIFWTILLQLIFAAGLLWECRLFGGERLKPLIWLLPAWALLSPTLTFTCLEFPKYTFAFAFMPLWFIGLAKKRYMPLSMAAAALSAVSHRAALGLVLLLGLGFLLFGALRPKLRQLVRNPYVLGAAILALAAVFLVGRRYFTVLDLQRFGGGGLQPALWTFMARPQIPIPMKIEVGMAFLFGLGAMWRGWSGKKAGNMIRGWLLFLILLFLPMGSDEVMGTGERLVLILPMAVLCMAGGTILGVKSRFWLRSGRGAAIGLLVSAATTGLCANSYLQWAHPQRLDPDCALYRQVALTVAPLHPEMLIAHRGLNFYYQFLTLGEAFAYEPEPHWPKERIWRVAYGVTASEWAYYLPTGELWGSGKFWPLPGPYTLIREDLWWTFRLGVENSEDEELRDRVLRLWLNPSERRPDFLYPKHRGEKSIGPFSALPED